MCSIILCIGAAGVFAAANRDEMVNRPWEPPAEFWPGICGGRDILAGGTWLALNRAGVLAAVLNREGTLGPAPGKESRGTLPLRALARDSAAEGAKAIGALDAGGFRAFNLVLADADGAFFIRGLGMGRPEIVPLAPGVHMITAGEPDDMARPRIAKHLPRFQATPFADWGKLLADSSGDRSDQLNVKAAQNDGFGTVCSSLVSLPHGSVTKHMFAAGPPDIAEFLQIGWNMPHGAEY
jgi:Transport and Golgi organisation 2